MKYVLKKLTNLIITLFIVSLLAFFAFQIIPADAALLRLGTSATPERLAQLRTEMGLDRPFVVQYGDWLFSFLQGDMGTSLQYNLPVEEMVMEKLPLTAALTLFACLLMVLLSVPIGLFTAYHAGGVFDRVMTVLNQVTMAIPPVFVGIVFSFVFGVTLRFFTPGEYVSATEDFWGFVRFLFFPALSIALSRIAMTVKLLRTALLDEMDKPYIRTAYSRGHSSGSALRHHALKNALVPTVVFMAVSAAELVAAGIIVEQVFAIPGLGRLLLSAIGSSDAPVVLAITMLLAVWVVTVNFLSDLAAQAIDPRIRLA